MDASLQDSRNHYADHLVEVNKGNRVLTTEDVYSDKGAVIVPKGTLLTPEIANKIARFKLSTPLEMQVNLEKIITPKTLHDEVHSISRQYAAIGLPIAPDFSKVLARHCIRLSEFPLVTQKLTVLRERLPIVYRNALITSGLALSVCTQMGLDDASTHVVFVATQMHDAGLLNIDPLLVNKPGQLTREEWRLLQGHVAIGKVFLDMVPGLSKNVGRAVFEHHERLDGTGYPQGKTREALSLEGQLIALVDTINAIFHNRLKPAGYHIRDLIPIVQMNSHVFPKEIHGAFLRLMQASRQGPTRMVKNDNISPLVHFLLVLQKILIHWYQLAEAFSQKLCQKNVCKRSQQVVLMVNQLSETIKQSGLFTDSLRDWLKSIVQQSNASDYQEVEHIALMFDEFCYQLQQLHKLMDLAVQGKGGAMEQECANLALLLKDIPSNRLKISGPPAIAETKVTPAEETE